MNEEINLEIQIGDSQPDRPEKTSGKSKKKVKSQKAKTAEQDSILGHTFESVQFSILSAIQNLWRNRLISISSILITAIMLITVYFSIGINFTTDFAITNIGKFVDLNVPLYNHVTPEQSESLINELELLPYVKSAKLKSKEQALSEFQLQYKEDLPDFITQYGLDNPLPDFIQITTETPEDQKKVVQFLTSPSYSGAVNTQSIGFDDNYESKIATFTKNTQSIQHSAIIVSIIFVILALMIVINAIHIAIHNRSKDITVMRIVGASKIQVQMPFIAESVISGLIAFVVSLVPYLILKNKFIPILSEQFNVEPAMINSQMSMHFIQWWIVIIVGLVLFNTIISSFLIHQFISKKILL